VEIHAPELKTKHEKRGAELQDEKNLHRFSDDHNIWQNHFSSSVTVSLQLKKILLRHMTKLVNWIEAGLWTKNGHPAVNRMPAIRVSGSFVGGLFTLGRFVCRPARLFKGKALLQESLLLGHLGSADHGLIPHGVNREA